MRLFVVTALAVLGAACGPAAYASSTFEGDAEGWKLSNNGDLTTPTLEQQGGNPAGALCGKDEGNGDIWYFVAPQKFLGNAGSAFGKRLTFDLRQGSIFNQVRGRDVVLNGGGLAVTWYSRFAPGLKRGDKVGTRQLIGYVGSTGRSTGPHLHFVAKKAGKFFNPMTLDLDGEYVMPAGDRPAFLELKAALDKRLDALVLPEPPPEPVAAAPTPSALPSGMPLDPAAAASPSAVQATAPPVAGAAMPAAPQPDPGDDESAGEIPLAPPPPPPPKNKH